MTVAKSQKIHSEKALHLMRTGSRLVELHGKSSFEWWVVPGGCVSSETAKQIKHHPKIVGQKDGLFPGLDQTWRMESFVSATDGSGLEAVK
jgi:hypothetical protein